MNINSRKVSNATDTRLRAGQAVDDDRRRFAFL